jgi:hypothetical protein
MYKVYAHFNDNNYLMIPNLTYPEAYKALGKIREAKSRSITRQWNNVPALIIDDNGASTCISPRIRLPR